MTGARFAADPPEARLIQWLDGLAIVFHRPSGATHILAEPAPQLLDALAQGPSDAPELLERLRAVFDCEADATDIEARLDELVEAGLAARL